MDEFEIEFTEYIIWRRKYTRKNARRRGMDLCRLCGKPIRIGYVFCQKCQERVDGEEP